MNPPQSELLSLAKRLITYETCDERSIHECAGFVEAWLEAREIEGTREIVRGRGVGFGRGWCRRPCRGGARQSGPRAAGRQGGTGARRCADDRPRGAYRRG